ncbi:MAG: hypothetical protein KBA02_08270 [Paludibacteraceae bacterium]|nr:hypothetical protein [Paludibacteraceae bacterium]
MDIPSFLLGMGVVLLIALCIGSVIALVKVIKVTKYSQNLQTNVGIQFGEINKKIDNVFIEAQHQIDDLNKKIDSRYDKLDDKIKKELLDPSRVGRIRQLISQE